MASKGAVVNSASAPQEGASGTDWFRTAVFYEVLVGAFQDSNGDGIGDIPGLISRLDYIRWLGVDCLWLLPMTASPLRDGGYDVSDYYDILPAYGTVEDMRTLLEEAHRRGIRVVMDLVLNHTSSDHHWFRAARSSPESEYRDWYVWSDTPEKYSAARIIFCDSQDSNWTWDETAGAFYWHRFFPHQPDLNYDNPAVREAMLDVVRYWLNLGLDGFRLDAAPYLFEREGTSCENLPETHAFLAEVREMVDREYGTLPVRVLLAEANQWPRDAVAYFGTAERPECHMCFHFPVMPRLFMALQLEDAGPVSGILASTPELPNQHVQSQWGIFLRNHDELTLEMVTPEEREYMWSRYAPAPGMRLNFGIRRRLAPLLGNSRPKLELLHGLLLSLPGSPFLYYGDEIGMGDDVSLADRDGLRTPMQWSDQINAGFSTANPLTLREPPISDPVFGFESINLESQIEEEHSFLHGLRQRIALRRRWPVFGTGSFTMLDSSTPAVFAFVRRESKSIVLCVFNFSHLAQSADLSVAGYEGLTPLELLNGARFPVIGSQRYPITLDPHGYVWLALTESSAGAGSAP